MSEQQPKHSYNEAVLHSALEDIVAVASGERQLIDADDAEGLAWVDKRARTALANYRQTPQPPACATADELERRWHESMQANYKGSDNWERVLTDAIAALSASEARVAESRQYAVELAATHMNLQQHLTARDQTIQRLREALGSDSHAITFQSMSQYRAALLRLLTDTTPTDKGDSA